MEQQLLAESDARPIIDLAAARLAEGWSVFTCAVTAERTGTRLYGGPISFDLGPLIQTIEAQGWRLDNINHAPGASSATASSDVRAHLLFRRQA